MKKNLINYNKILIKWTKNIKKWNMFLKTQIIRDVKLFNFIKKIYYFLKKLLRSRRKHDKNSYIYEFFPK